MHIQNFSKIFRSNNKVFGPVQIPKKAFSLFFSSISWGLCTSTKCEKVVLFGFITVFLMIWKRDRDRCVLTKKLSP
jgi:hypothetical protein